jgi:hypothetical protein
MVQAWRVWVSRGDGGRLTAHRPALLSEELHDTLNEYLRFRHVFRNAYSFDLDWQKMSPLVLRLEETFQKLESALDDFLK